MKVVAESTDQKCRQDQESNCKQGYKGMTEIMKLTLL